MLRFAFATTLAAVALAAGALWLVGGDSTPAVAHGVVDQSQTTSTTVSFNGSQPMMQSFIPTATSLVAVDIKGTAPFGDEPDMLWTVALRKDWVTSAIIALHSHVGLSGTETVYHIEFPSPVALTPGDTYWLEVAGEGNHFQWALTLTGDPYPNGEPDSAVEDTYPDADRYFVTYSAPPVTPTPSQRPGRTSIP